MSIWWLESSAEDGAVLEIDWLESSASGTIPSSPAVQWLGSSASGQPLPTIIGPAPQTVDAGTVVSLTASQAPGSATVTSWSWRQISGPSVSLVTSGGTATFRSPSQMPPASPVVIGVTGGSADGYWSVERTVTITVLPEALWSRVHGGNWVGARLAVTIGV